MLTVYAMWKVKDDKYYGSLSGDGDIAELWLKDSPETVGKMQVAIKGLLGWETAKHQITVELVT